MVHIPAKTCVSFSCHQIVEYTLEISHKRSKMKWQARTPEIHADDNIQLDHSLIGSTRNFIEEFETSIVSIGVHGQTLAAQKQMKCDNYLI